MREPSQQRRLDLLHAALLAGASHLDVAPAYGLGHAERVVGRFLSTLTSSTPRPTVTTKVGLRPSRLGMTIAPLQAPARRLAAALRQHGVTGSHGQTANKTVRLHASAIERSVRRSLRDLQLPFVDYLLLHEADPTSLSATALRALEQLRRDGKYQEFGTANTQEHPVAQNFRPAVSALQYPFWRGSPSTWQNARTLITFSVFQCIESLERALHVDRALRGQLESNLQRPLRTRSDTAQGLIYIALYTRRPKTVLVGSTSPSHIHTACEVLNWPPLPTSVADEAYRSISENTFAPPRTSRNR